MTKFQNITAAGTNFLTTASRSALLSSEETNGKGVRPGSERVQVLAAGLTGGYDLETFSRTKVEAFVQRENTPVDPSTLAKALVVTGAPWQIEYTYSVDIFFPTDDDNAPLWVGYIEAEEVVVGPLDANGYVTLEAMVDDGEIITYEFNTLTEWYEPKEFDARAFKPKSRERLG